MADRGRCGAQSRRSFRDAVKAPPANRVAPKSTPVWTPPPKQDDGAAPTKVANGAPDGQASAAVPPAVDGATQAVSQTSVLTSTAQGSSPGRRKKGGVIAARAEAAAEDALAAKSNPAAAAKKTPKSTKAKKRKDGEEGAARPAKYVHVHKHPKPRVLTQAVFLWERVAAFSEPFQVLVLERVCVDIAAALRASHKGTQLMQRYWNAQWARLVWEEGEIAVEKRLLLPSSLSRSEGKMNWRKMFKEEYPLWLQRTFQGVGQKNNATNAAKVLFHQEQLNEAKSAAEMQRSELTVTEALLKAQQKRGVNVDLDNEGANGDAAGADDDVRSVEGGGGGGKREGGGRGGGKLAANGKGRHSVRVPVHDPSAGFSRDDYKQDFRQGSRKGKHQKGGDKKWSSYGGGVDDDY